ncbi:MAG: hypothetical protein DHS20C13_16470 [Thermodesulfobacteriota bacterium]|nr:MAG: hypothetical protein DHS20C13_16470 [Thermodesulfobacteriota bacterium]
MKSYLNTALDIKDIGEAIKITIKSTERITKNARQYINKDRGIKTNLYKMNQSLETSITIEP